MTGLKFVDEFVQQNVLIEVFLLAVLQQLSTLKVTCTRHMAL